MYAASRERQLPAFISCINVENHSPRVSLFLNVVLAMAFSFMGNIEQLISYVAFTMWMQRAFTMAALLYIRMTNKPVHPEAIRTPIVIPILFFCVCLALVVVTIAQSFHTSSVGLLMLFIGLLTYTIFLWEKALPRVALYEKWSNGVNRKSNPLEPLQFVAHGMTCRELMCRITVLLQWHNHDGQCRRYAHGRRNNTSKWRVQLPKHQNIP